MTEIKNPLIAIKGKCMWAMVQEPNKTFDARQSGGPDKNYEISVECDDELFAKLQKAGIHSGTKLRTFEGVDGKYLKLKKSAVKTTRKGEVIEFPPLEVLDINQKPLTCKVGNGSTVNCIVELVKGKFCTILRLRSVQVVDLVEYVDHKENYAHLLEGSSDASQTSGISDVGDVFSAENL